MKQIVEESFSQYAAAVLQNRALVDARDCIKPSARQIFYCMYTDNFVHNKPFQKTLKAIGSAMRVYIHGDSSCEGVIMRAGQPFSMRYPLVEIEGSYGNLMESGNHAAPRYTASRLSELSNHLFTDLKKDVIEEWRDNYDDTEKYPAILPSKGFYNIVNGNFGLGVGAASSIPQFNIKDVNEALIKLLWNPNADFDELYCTPDFATGAVLLNENEVKESLRNGYGFACKLRAVVEFDAKERCFVVKEIPYGVYTNTICGELEKILNSDENPGVDRFNDLTGSTPNIKIYLTKSANVDKVLRYLYKNTSLQSHFGINLTMLDNGRFPKVFTWKEALGAHLDHEVEVYTRGYQFDLNKINARLHVIDGLLKAINAIDEVVKTIRSSSSTAAASIALQTLLAIDGAQAKAILDIKLSKLAHLEVNKLVNEQNDLSAEKERIEAILNDSNLLKKEVENGLRTVASRFGDARRTKILNISKDGEEEPTEIKQLQVSLTNKNCIYTTENSTLYTQRRGGVGNKIKLDSGEFVISTHQLQSDEEILLFSKGGNVFHCPSSNLPINEKIHIQSIVPAKDWEVICAMTSANKKTDKPYIIFVTKNGMVKKSELSEYNINRNVGLKAITLDEGDEIVNVVFTSTDRLGILTETGNFLLIETEDIRPIGRVAKGVKGIKLNEDDYVISARIVLDNTISIATISGAGLFKRTDFKEFTTQGRATKGAKIQKVNDGDWLADFCPISVQDKDVLIAATSSCIKLSVQDVPIFSKGALGNKSIKLNPTDNVIGISIY